MLTFAELAAFWSSAPGTTAEDIEDEDHYVSSLMYFILSGRGVTSSFCYHSIYQSFLFIPDSKIEQVIIIEIYRVYNNVVRPGGVADKGNCP